MYNQAEKYSYSALASPAQPVLTFAAWQRTNGRIKYRLSQPARDTDKKYGKKKSRSVLLEGEQWAIHNVRRWRDNFLSFIYTYLLVAAGPNAAAADLRRP